MEREKKKRKREFLARENISYFLVCSLKVIDNISGDSVGRENQWGKKGRNRMH